MSFQLLEKKEVNCVCFQCAETHVKKIFNQSQSIFQLTNSQYKSLLLAKSASSKLKTKKKSLRNQKHVTLQCSQNSHSRQLSKDELNLTPESQQIKKQQRPKTADFPIIRTTKSHECLPIVSKNIVFRSQVDPLILKNNFTKTLVKNQYEKLVDEEFRKDLHLFCLSMQMETQNSKQNFSKKCNQEKTDKFKINQSNRYFSERRVEKLYAKQIESEKGTDTESVISEVVEHSWKGLTWQRIEIQDLQEMTYDEKLIQRSQTMITRESQIKSSKIQASTECASSFIKPRVSHRTSTNFGSTLQRFGAARMSYQNFADFSRFNSSVFQNDKR